MRGPSSGAVRSAHSTSGRPHHCASSLGEPNRVAPPAASTIVPVGFMLRLPPDRVRRASSRRCASRRSRGCPAVRPAGRPDRAATGMLATPPAATSTSLPNRATAMLTSGNEKARRSPRRRYAEASGGASQLDRGDDLADVEVDQRPVLLGRPAVQVGQVQLALAVRATAGARWRGRPAAPARGRTGGPRCSRRAGGRACGARRSARSRCRRRRASSSTRGRGSTSSACAGRGCRRPFPGCGGAARPPATPPRGRPPTAPAPRWRRRRRAWRCRRCARRSPRPRWPRGRAPGGRRWWPPR